MSTSFADDLVALLPRLRRFALSLTGASDTADDLVQACCERALRARDQWQEGTRLDAWLFRILRNLWIDQIRRRKTEGPVEALDEAGAVDGIELQGTDGRTTAEAALTIGDLERAIAGLPEEQRAVITRVCLEEMSYREAAETLGVPIGTVMSRLARARRSLAAATGIAVGLDNGG